MPIATRTFTVFARERVEMKRKQMMGSDEDKCDRGREGVLTLKHLRIQFLRIQTLISSIDGSALVWWQGIPPIPPKL